MKMLRLVLVLTLLAALPVWAGDPFAGTWRMRPDAKSGGMKQVITITPVGDGAKVDTEVDFGNGTTMSMTYTSRFDGVEVPVYSAGKVVMTIRAKKTGPDAYEGSTTGPNGTSTFRTTFSADGRTMTSDSVTGPIKSHVVFDRVK